MNVISLLKRMGCFREPCADDIPAALQPMRPDIAASVAGESDTTDLTPASWPSGERKQRQLLLWSSDIRETQRTLERSGT